MTAGKHALLAALVLLATACVYYPGIGGPFIFDDFENITNRSEIAIPDLGLESLGSAAFFNRNSANWTRAIPRITFALNYYLPEPGFDPVRFKITNIFIHGLNALVVYLLAFLLIGRLRDLHRDDPAWQGHLLTFAPAVIAAVWTLHPIQLTSVLYVVQRMTSLAGTFVLLGAAGYVWGRTMLEQGRGAGMTVMLAATLLGTVLGVLCKENAALLPVFVLLIELFFFDRARLDARRRRQLALYAVAIVGFMGCMALVILLVRETSAGDLYQVRNFEPIERLMTESRVLFMYLGMMFVPLLSRFGLFHDDIELSIGLLSPWTTAVSVALWLVLLALALRGLRSRHLAAFAVLWYLGGHAVESSFIGLEIAYEHRNYVPSFGVFFVAVTLLLMAAGREQALRKLWPGVASALAVVLALLTFTRATAWQDHASIAEATARNHPDSYRAHFELGVAYEQSGQDARLVYDAYRRAAALSPVTVYPLVRMQRIVDALARHLDGEAPPRSPDDVPPIDLLTHPIELDRGVLVRLDAAIDREVTARLSRSAINAETMGALLEVRLCIVQKSNACLPLDRAIRWVTLVMEHPRVLPGQLVEARVSLGKFLAAKGEASRAIEQLELAIEESRSIGTQTPYYRIELADLHVVLADFERAEQILASLEADPAVVHGWGHELSMLRDFLETARGQATSP